MPIAERAVVRFLAEYEARLNRALRDEPLVDVEATATAFMNCFIAATPQEVICNQNDEEFRAAIPRGFEYYRSIGTRLMKISSLQVMDLDECHAMAKVRWHSLYRKPDSSEVTLDFDVFYLFHLVGEEPRIFAYITGDEEGALREHGLVAS